VCDPVAEGGDELLLGGQPAIGHGIPTQVAIQLGEGLELPGRRVQFDPVLGDRVARRVEQLETPGQRPGVLLQSVHRLTWCRR